VLTHCLPIAYYRVKAGPSSFARGKLEARRWFTVPHVRLLQAIHELKQRKAPGSDQISNEMLRNLPAEGNTELLGIINDSWNTCEVPTAWRTQTSSGS
jgi:hypothetical protein